MLREGNVYSPVWQSVCSGGPVLPCSLVAHTFLGDQVVAPPMKALLVTARKRSLGQGNPVCHSVHREEGGLPTPPGYRASRGWVDPPGCRPLGLGRPPMDTTPPPPLGVGQTPPGGWVEPPGSRPPPG